METTHAVYIWHDNNPVEVRYSHLTEQQADDEVDRLADAFCIRGIPHVRVWQEQHPPDFVFVIG